jgi:hypothetical protein
VPCIRPLCCSGLLPLPCVGKLIDRHIVTGTLQWILDVVIEADEDLDIIAADYYADPDAPVPWGSYDPDCDPLPSWRAAA